MRLITYYIRYSIITFVYFFSKEYSLIFCFWNFEYVNHILSTLWNKYLKNDENIVLKDPKKMGKKGLLIQPFLKSN